MPTFQFDCKKASEVIPLFQKNIMSVRQLGNRVIRSSIIASIITLISHSIALHNSVKDFRVITPLVFAIWTSAVVFIIGVVGGFYRHVPLLCILSIFSPMAAALPLSFTISYMHLSMCLATPWSYNRCSILPCMNANASTMQFNNQCSLDELKMVGCPMLPGDSCQVDDLKDIISEKNRIIDIISFCACLLPAAYSLLLLVRIETGRLAK